MGLREFLKKTGIRMITRNMPCITSAILSCKTDYGVGDVWADGKRVFTFGTFTRDTDDFDKVIQEMEAVVTRLMKKGVILGKHIGIKELEDINTEIMNRNPRFKGMN
jgi:hypothetical protein